MVAGPLFRFTPEGPYGAVCSHQFSTTRDSRPMNYASSFKTSLRVFAPDIWVVDGPRVNSIGPWKHSTRMIVVRLTDGSLWINSPITASEDEMRSLEHLGPVRYLVAPVRFHVWRLSKWRDAFPDAETWGPSAVGSSLEGIAFDEILGSEPPIAWRRDLDQKIFRGIPYVDEAEFLHRASRTLIVGDYIQEPRSPVSYVTRPLVKFSSARRSEYRGSREHLLAWDFDKVILAHGPCVETSAKTYVEKALNWL